MRFFLSFLMLVGISASQGVAANTYDAWGRMTAVEDAAEQSVLTLKYDAIGRLIERTLFADGVETAAWRYGYDGSRIIDIDRKLTGESWTHVMTIIHGLEYVDEPVAMWVYESIDPLVVNFYYFVRDANYNVVAMVDEDGNVVEQYAYSPYGELIAVEDGSGNSIDPATTPLISPFLHQGLLYLPEIKCYYNRARIYSPSLGRFLQRDSNELAQVLFKVLLMNAESQRAFMGISAGSQYFDGMNLYQAYLSNPLINRDPSGLSADSDIWDRVDDALYGITTERFAAIDSVAERITLLFDVSMKIGETVMSLLPGGDAMLLGIKWLSGADFDATDFLYAAASVGGAALVIKTIKAARKASHKFTILLNRFKKTRAAAARGGFNGRRVWGRLDTLDDHFRRHGADFRATSADDYAQKAADFFQNSQSSRLPTKIDSNGVIRVYDPKTNTFGAYNPDGTTRTFFKPKRGQTYWDDQPGSAPWEL